MINEIKQNAKVIEDALTPDESMSISDMERDLKLARCQIRIAVAYLLGAEVIAETKYGMAKVYYIKWTGTQN